MFGLFAPTCPLETAEKAWVERRMRWLAERLGPSRLLDATVVLPTDAFFPGPYWPNEVCARHVLDHVCGYMQVNPRSLTLTVLPDEAMPGAVGLYQRRARPGPSRRTKANIFVAASELADPPSLIATLAHEVGHEILLGGGLLSEESTDHEQVTDLVTVALGLGIFNANATLWESRWNDGATYSGWTMGRRGYLSVRMFGYALGVFAHVRGEAKPTWARYLRPDARGPMKKGLRYLRKASDSLFSPDATCAARPTSTPSELLARLTHRSPTFRLDALWELAQIGADSPDLLAAVCRCLDDPDQGVRAEAARTLAIFGPAARDAIPRLLELVQTEAEVWPCALPTLVAIGAGPAVVVAEVAYLLPRKPEHAGLLAKILRDYGPAAGPAIPALMDAFGRELASGQVGEVLAAVRELVPDLEARARKHFARDPELLQHALWELRHAE